MMSQIKCATVVLVLVAVGTASALVCIQCSGVNACRGADRYKTVTCDRNNSDATAVLLRPYLKDLNASLEYDKGYQCTNYTYIPKGAADLTDMVKGCLLKTKTGLCGVEKNTLNGNLTCISCTMDKCNGAGELTWSTLLLIGGLVISSIVA
uniref:Putative salivary secreted peptide n=1 Tax=Aedes albopictus TaxID=7160 RepID=A0A1W7R7N4_AEDAL